MMHTSKGGGMNEKVGAFVTIGGIMLELFDAGNYSCCRPSRYQQ
jgi:hypothetical protein